MTDSRLPDDTRPIPDDDERADAASRAEDRENQPGPTGAETPGAPTSSEPMTDSTDGGLDGGDPGVEE